MSAGRLFALALAGAILCVAAFALLTPAIFFGAQAMFDARIGGYNADEAQAYLGWLAREGLVELYRGPVARIDFIFPVTLAVALGAAIWGVWARPVRMVARLGVLLCAVYLGFDYAENAAVGALLAEGAERVSDGMIARASQWTQLKWTALMAGGMLVLAGVALTFLKGGRR